MVELTIDTKPIFDLDSDGFPFSVEKFIAASYRERVRKTIVSLKGCHNVHAVTAIRCSSPGKMGND